MTSPPTSTILLKGGTLLLHDDDDHVVPTRADLLIRGNTIAQIASDIPLPPSPSPPCSSPSTTPATTRVIDCAGRLVSPGFVSTHAHLWQTQLKGRHAHHTLAQYLPDACYRAALVPSPGSGEPGPGPGPGGYTAADLFWGQLAGALESLDAGTTTVVDHAHLNPGGGHDKKQRHPRAAVQALATSGLRAVYCYAPPRAARSLDPLVLDEADLARDGPAVLDEWARFAGAVAAAGWNRGGGGVGDSGDGVGEDGKEQQQQQHDGRVTVGFALDNLYLPTPHLAAAYERLRHNHPPARVITSHAVDGPRAVGILAGAGLLGPDVLLSHANGLRSEDVALLRAAGARVSSTPLTEMQMGLEAVAMRRDVLGEGAGVEAGLGSLGVDCHSWGTSYLPAQMSLALQQRRLVRAREVAAAGGKDGAGGWARRLEGTVEEAFNLGTVAGARAAGLAGSVGRLRAGYRADVVVLEGASPGMLAAAARDPVAAVVLHSSVRDVRVVIADGVVRKEGGRLCDVCVEEAPPLQQHQGGLVVEEGEGEGEGEGKEEFVEVGSRLSWEDVARELLRSREALDARLGDIDCGPAEEAVIDAFHMNRADMVER